MIELNGFKQKFNKALLTIIKVIAIVFFSLTLFDKMSFTFLKDFIVNLNVDIIYIVAYSTFIFLKSLVLGLPILFGIVVFLIHMLFAVSMITLLFYFIFSRKFSYFNIVSTKNKYEIKKTIYLYNTIYLENSRFLC